MFNTGDSAPPSVFNTLIDSDEESATSAIIYGREGIANCVDASIAAQNGHGSLGLDFFFELFTGEDALNYWDLLDLQSLAARASAPGIDRVKILGLSATDCLTAGPRKPLRILTVIERGGGGMPGSLADPDSVLLRALMNIGEAQSRTGAAGSYGYGKAAVAQASRPRILIVYTCTRLSDSPDGVTRRLMGIAYWGNHSFNGTKYTGWGIFVNNDAGALAALENEEADAFAERLDIPVRSPAAPDDIGTTFMIIDPVFDAHDLKGAAEIFWWPLLQNTRALELDLSIHDEDGNCLEIEVNESHPQLGQFIARFKEAEKSRKTGDEMLTPTSLVLNRGAGISSLEVTNPESPIDSTLVALMRSPLMVVTYQPVKGSNQPLVGVFVSHDRTNENLRRVEPPEHDKWLKKRVGGLVGSPEDFRISKMVAEEVGNAVRALRMPEPEPITDLSDFSKFFPAIEGGIAKPKPPRPLGSKKQRLVHVNLVHSVNNLYVPVERPQREQQTDGKLKARAVVRFWLDKERAARVKRDFLDATITIGARIDEDGPRGEWIGAQVKEVVVGRKSKFKNTTTRGGAPATFEGRFKIGEDIFFQIETEPYDSDWTVDLIFDCSPWDVSEPKRNEPQGDS